MKVVVLSRAQGRARKCVFRCSLGVEWQFCSNATRSGQRRSPKR